MRNRILEIIGNFYATYFLYTIQPIKFKFIYTIQPIKFKI
ncbi:hypothetical protein LTSERUB_0723 [Salmonella enterica subsp. enterica serovar Rubislaw str. A4-653]|uniref:Uncharacterized protein n=1 Tax=Salmonella enterica subsp. enterica serovar Rubislaw str. A4-653 TaxID=913081 RepID=G5QEL1_SALRU|nr:hypothetical protein LTSERUB_0723 [Salmonella enterica subsp. enterica serovar Rubislaw str. A4-653]